MKTPKNYYVYFLNGKIHRQAIKLNDIYPEFYAMQRIPDGAETIAKFFWTRGDLPFANWLKHEYYYEPQTLWDKNQEKFREKYFPMLTKEEQNLLLTQKIGNKRHVEDNPAFPENHTED
ncbi:MAG: hypothetical protein WA061_02010 [Microgenomates group bacterium]